MAASINAVQLMESEMDRDGDQEQIGLAIREERGNQILGLYENDDAALKAFPDPKHLMERVCQNTATEYSS